MKVIDLVENTAQNEHRLKILNEKFENTNLYLFLILILEEKKKKKGF